MDASVEYKLMCLSVVLFCFFFVVQTSRGAVSRLMESMAADEDFEPNQDSSFSEDELVPPRSLSVPERSSSPGRPHASHFLTLSHTHAQTE